MEGKRTDFCPECRKYTEYTMEKIDFPKIIGETPHVFRISSAFCRECGCEVSPQGIIDEKVREIQEQYLKRKRL